MVFYGFLDSKRNIGIIQVFNCSRREEIIVNVCLHAKFPLDPFEFSSDFYGVDFFGSA